MSKNVCRSWTDGLLRMSIYAWNVSIAMHLRGGCDSLDKSDKQVITSGLRPL